MMLAVAILAAFAVSVLFAGRELGRERPREGALMLTVSIMVVLAVLAGGALTSGVL